MLTCLEEQNLVVEQEINVSVGRSIEMHRRCMDLLDGLIAHTRVMGDKTERTMQDMREDIKAQTSALLTLIDEIRSQR